MKKLRLFDSLKFMLATVACVFILNVAHADIPAGYTQITSGDTTNYPNTLTGYTKYTITNASWGTISASTGGEAYYRYLIDPENIVGNGAQISNMFKSASIVTTNTAVGFSFYYSSSSRGTFVAVRDSSKFTNNASARTYFNEHPLIILVKTTTATDNVYQLVKRDSDGVIGYYCATGTNAGDFVPAFGAMEYNSIKIATTRYNEEKFEPVQNRLSDAMDAVDDVVTRTMTQAQAIDQIANEKQTRPDEGCPAKYCLLVEGEDGTPHWYPIAGANGVEYVLPAGYTQLEYIESDGSSWIIVPYRVNNKTVFYARYNEIQKGQQSNASAVFGVTSTPDTSKANYGIVRLLDGTASFNRMGWGDSTSGSVINVNAPKNLNTWYEVLYDQNKLYQDNVLYATSATSNDTEWVANYDLGIFARNSATVTMPAIAKISSVWAKEDGVYKINLVPAKNSSGVVGLYDLVSGQFFTNAGTGVFGEGPVVE